MSTSISVVMPVHNEEEYLPYSLKSLIKAPINELIIILDRCIDRSESIIEKTKFPFKVKIIHKHKQNWHCCTAEVFELGFKHATCDLFFTMAADFILDTNCINSKWFKNADIISFFYYNFDLHSYRVKQWYLNFLKKHINIARIWKGEQAWHSGHMAFKREVWKKLHIHDVPSEYDDLQTRAVKAGFQYRFIKETKNYHLRVGLSRNRQTLQGMSRAHNKVNPLLVFGHSLLLLKPYVFSSFMHERRSETFKRRKWGKSGYES